MAIASTTMQKKVYNEVLQKIITGDLLPETQLVHRKLAAELGVSPTPVREALNSLARDGIIENHPRWGYFTKKFSFADIVMILDVRENIESMAARLAARLITKLGIVTLEEACKDYSQALNQDDLKVIISKDQNLHNAIAVISGNKYLEKIIDNHHLLYVISWSVQLLHDGMNSSDFHSYLKDCEFVGLRGHQDIVKAISNHNEQEAERLMKAHIGAAKNEWREFFEKKGCG